MSCRAGGRVADTTATAISNPPKAAAAASLTDRLMSVPGPEAAETLAALGVEKVDLRCGSGLDPWPDGGTFDAILVACAPAEIPRVFVDQLSPGGRLVVPVGPSGQIQMLQRIRRQSGGTLAREHITQVRFVPMLD